jgi:hypothetical protein
MEEGMMRRFLMLGMAATLLPRLAAADVIVLKAGGRIEGEVVEQRPDRVVIDVPAGRVTLPRTLIEKTVVGSSSLAEFRARAARLADGDVDGWLALADWARAHELLTQSRDAYQHVLWIQPLNAAAHQALGHVFMAGHWMTQDDAYRARGFVQFEGNWMSLEERQATIEERAAYAAERRERLEADARIREAEARARTAEAEARRAEAAEEAEANMGDGIPLGYGYGGGGYGGFGGGVPVFAPGDPGLLPPPPPIVVVAPRPPQRDGGHRRSQSSAGRTSTAPAQGKAVKVQGPTRRR